MLEGVKSITIWLATITECIAGIIIALSVIEATARTALVFLQQFEQSTTTSHEAKEAVRLRLGRWLALALAPTYCEPRWRRRGQKSDSSQLSRRFGPPSIIFFSKKSTKPQSAGAKRPSNRVPTSHVADHDELIAR